MEANKYVTLEDQDKIMSNAVALLRNIQKRNQPLPNKGDKVTVTVKKQEVIPEAPAQSQVPVVSEQTLVEKQPELAEQAREEFNEAYEAATGEELFPYETPEQQQESDQKMQEQDTQKITNYYYEVLRWYEENGYNDEFSDAVREAQAVLDPSAFEAAKNTGIGRYEDANGPEYEGGDEDYDSEFDDVDTNATGENNQEITDSTVVIAPDEKTPDPTPTPAPVETKEPVVEQPVESQKPVETEEPSPEPTKEPEKVVISPFDDDETIEYPTPSNTPEVPVEEGSHISSDFADIDISDITTEARNTKDFSQLSDEQKFMYALQILSDEELSALFAPTNASSIENTNTHRI